MVVVFVVLDVCIQRIHSEKYQSYYCSSIITINMLHVCRMAGVLAAGLCISDEPSLLDSEYTELELKPHKAVSVP